MEQMEKMSGPHAVLKEMREQARVMNLSPSENEEFDKIIEEFEAKTISTEEAFRRVEALMYSKQEEKD